MGSVIEEITKLSLKKYDPNGIHNVYDKWAHIAKDAYDSEIEPVDFKDIDNVVFSGMGGSGTIGDLFSSILSKTNVHTTVVKGYELPNTVDENTLVVITSVSGNTAETLTTLQSATKKILKQLRFRQVERWNLFVRKIMSYLEKFLKFIHQEHHFHLMYTQF